MRIISYNIQYGTGMDGEMDLVRACNRIRGADLICLQEIDQGWARSGNLDQAAEIAGLLPTYYSVFGASFDVDASSRAAHGAVVNRRRRHGNLILSRWPILSSRCFNLPKQHYDERFNLQMGFLEAVIDNGERAIRLYNYHGGYLESSERLSQVREFAAVFNRSVAEHGAWSGKADIDGEDWSNGRRLPAMPESAIVCGDFNASPESAEYELLLRSTGLVDCWAAADPERLNHSTLLKTATEDNPGTGKVDHVLVTPDLAGEIVSAVIDDDCRASDHKPLEVRLGSVGQ